MAESEPDRWEPTDGFPAVAEFMARDPDHETYVFRKFKRLTGRTLLHLQSELIDLEQQLEDLDRDAARSPDMEQNWFEVKWCYRDDCVSALMVSINLGQLPYIY